MVFIIEILFVLVFFALLAKAIFETIWGICIIIHGLFWHTVGYSFSALAIVLHFFDRMRNQTTSR